MFLLTMGSVGRSYCTTDGTACLADLTDMASLIAEAATSSRPSLMKLSAATSTCEAIQTARQVCRKLSLLLCQPPQQSLKAWAVQALPKHRLLLHSQFPPPSMLHILGQRQAGQMLMGRAKTAIARAGQEESLEHVLQHRGQNPAQTWYVLGSPNQQAARPQQQCQAQGASRWGAWVAGPCQMTAQRSQGCLAV